MGFGFVFESQPLESVPSGVEVKNKRINSCFPLPHPGLWRGAKWNTGTCRRLKSFLVRIVTFWGSWGSVAGSIPGVAGVFFRGIWQFHVPGVDSAPKNEYQVNPGGKSGRCVRLTPFHLHVPMSRNLGALTSWNPVGRPVMGQLYVRSCLLTVLYMALKINISKYWHVKILAPFFLCV
jgi:hypothetical protein